MVRMSVWSLAALSLVGVQARLEYRRRGAAATPIPRCTQTASPVVNGDFESGSLSPWIIGSEPMLPGVPPSTVQVVSGGRDSNYAMQMSLSYDAKVTQKYIPSCRATNYAISFDYKALAVEGTCNIYSTAGQDKYHSFNGGASSIRVGDWSTVTYNYPSDLTNAFAIEVGIYCEYSNGSATILVDNIKALPAGTEAGSGCPKSIGLQNGGFDSGQLAPWTVSPPPDENKPDYQISSPGYNSQYAFQADFPAADSTDWYIEQDFTNLCEGYNYQISWAINWYNYTGPTPGGPSSPGCSISVLADGCEPPPNTSYNYATSTPGWQAYSYTCQAGQNDAGYIGVSFMCFGGSLPAWGVQVDGFTLELIGPGPETKRANARRTAVRNKVAKRHQV